MLRQKRWERRFKMKRANGIIAVFVVLAFLVTLGPSQASAQVLDQMWFKLKCKFKTYVVDDVAETVKKNNFTETIYAYFEWDVPGSEYRVEYWAKQTSGDWQMISSGDAVQPLPNEDAEKAILSDFEPTYEDGSGLDVDFWLSPLMKVKKRKTTIKGTGSCEGQDASGDDLYGHAIVNGKDVKESKLPFTP
jgi:hypothetical protein